MNSNITYVFFIIALLFGALFFSGIVYVESGRLSVSPIETVDTSLILLIVLVASGFYIYVVWQQIREEDDDDFLYPNKKIKK